MLVLDTSAIIEILKETKNGIKIVESISGLGTAITSISVHEILVGAKEKEIPLIQNFFSSIQILDYDTKAAIESSRLENQLTSNGIKINIVDTFIAGICLANNSKLITLDKDFEKIDELEVQTVR